MWPKYLMKFKSSIAHTIVISVMVVNLITAVGLRFRSLIKKYNVHSNADTAYAARIPAYSTVNLSPKSPHLDKIATETLFVVNDSHTHPEQHIKNIDDRM